MKKFRFNISYLIGILLIGLIIFEFVRMLQNMDYTKLVFYIPEMLCYIGGLIFVLGNILGFMPVSVSKRELFDALIGFLLENEERKTDMYKVPEELEKQLNKNMKDEETLNLIAKDIVSFCGVDSTNLNIKYQRDLAEAAGTYNTDTNEINLSLMHTRTVSEVMAVLIHECMHYILNEKDLWLKSREQNEYLTDIACIYFGFGDYINKGYIMVGYLKRSDIRYVRRMLKYIDEDEEQNEK